MKRVLLCLLFVLAIQSQSLLQENLHEYTLSDIQLNTDGQFFYDTRTDQAILIQPRANDNHIKLYESFSITKFSQVKTLTLTNLPHQLTSYKFVPQIQQILYPAYSTESGNFTISSISYYQNDLKHYSFQTKISQIESIQYQPLSNTIANVFICGYGKQSDHSIEVLQINDKGNVVAFKNILRINTTILKTLKNLYTIENEESQQFSMNRYSLIYLSFLLEQYLETKLNNEQYLELVDNQLVSILAIDMFYTQKNDLLSLTDKLNLDDGSDDLLNKSVKVKRLLKKMKDTKENLLVENKGSQKAKVKIDKLYKSLAKKEIAEGRRNLFYSADTPNIIVEEDGEDIEILDQIICLIIQEDINKDQNPSRVLECSSIQNNSKISLELIPHQKIIADAETQKLITILPYEGGKSQIYYYNLNKLDVFNETMTFQDLRSVNECILFYSFQDEIPHGFMIDEKILILKESLKHYYECNTYMNTMSRHNIPQGWHKMEKDDSFVYYIRGSYSLFLFENRLNKQFNLSEGSEKEMLDIHHYGRKILALVPAFFFVAVLLFCLLRWNRYQKTQSRLKAQIASFSSKQITYYQFRLRYIKREDYMKAKVNFYFNQSAQSYNNNGCDIYVDQFHPSKCYMVRQIKILSFQNQDYVQDYIKTHLSLYRYEGVQQIKHYCVIPEQSAYIVTDVPLRTLQSQIEQQIETLEQFDDKTILKIAKNVMQTLFTIEQEMGLAHRDIKPNSIVLDQDGKYKLSNFRPKQFHLAQNYMLILSQGSIAFMAPQARFQIEVQMSNINFDPDQEENQSYEIYSKASMEADNYNFMDIVRNEEDIALYNTYKADLFSLGLTLLFATTKLGVDGLNINKELLNQRLVKLQSIPNFSEKTKNMIVLMLKWEEEDRPTYSELLELLED